MPGGPFIVPIDTDGVNIVGPMAAGEATALIEPDLMAQEGESMGLGPMPILVIVCARDMTSPKVTGRR